MVLGDLTLETSTDPDDAWAAGPPSPCNGEFANAYIVINGKSSMRNKTSRSNNKVSYTFWLSPRFEIQLVAIYEQVYWWKKQPKKLLVVKSFGQAIEALWEGVVTTAKTVQSLATSPLNCGLMLKQMNITSIFCMHMC